MSTATAGIAEIGFACRDGVTRLADLYQCDPLRVLFPAPDDGDPPLAVIVTTSGGLVGGDRLDIRVRVEAGAAAHVTGSAAEKIYRSLGPTTAIGQSLSAAAGSWLEFLPPETILFDGARLRREIRVDLEPGAGFLGGDIVIFGRRARGERFTKGLLHEAWELRREGRLVWGDALHLADNDGAGIAAIIADPACFAGAAGFASLVFVPPDGDPQRFLDAAREIQRGHAGEGLRTGATALAGLLLARWLAWDTALLRRAYADLACHLRAATMGWPARLPRLWHV